MSGRNSLPPFPESLLPAKTFLPPVADFPSFHSPDRIPALRGHVSITDCPPFYLAAFLSFTLHWELSPLARHQQRRSRSSLPPSLSLPPCVHLRGLSILVDPLDSFYKTQSLPLFPPSAPPLMTFLVYIDGMPPSSLSAARDDHFLPPFFVLKCTVHRSILGPLVPHVHSSKLFGLLPLSQGEDHPPFPFLIVIGYSWCLPFSESRKSFPPVDEVMYVFRDPLDSQDLAHSLPCSLPPLIVRPALEERLIISPMAFLPFP